MAENKKVKRPERGDKAVVIEVEVRACVPIEIDAIEVARQAGFQVTKTSEQVDIMHDRPDGQLFKSGSKIRIRRDGDEAELTYKGSFLGDSSASRRTETNAKIDVSEISNMQGVLEALGFPMLFQVKKTRTKLTRNDVQLTVDNWPIIGPMVEIEGEESLVKAVAEELFPSIEFLGFRLKELFEKRSKLEGKTIQELKQEYESKSGFTLGNIEFLLA